MKASQLARIEALKLRAEADKAYYSSENATWSSNELYKYLIKQAEEMAVLALEFEQEERSQTTTADGGGR